MSGRQQVVCVEKREMNSDLLVYKEKWWNPACSDYGVIESATCTARPRPLTVFNSASVAMSTLHHKPTSVSEDLPLQMLVPGEILAAARAIVSVEHELLDEASDSSSKRTSA